MNRRAWCNMNSQIKSKGIIYNGERAIASMRQWTCFKEAKEQYFTYLRAGCLNVYRYGTGLICKDNVQKIVPDTRHCKWNATFPTRWLIQSQQREQKTGNLRDPLQQLTLLAVWISTTNLTGLIPVNFQITNWHSAKDSSVRSSDFGCWLHRLSVA